MSDLQRLATNTLMRLISMKWLNMTASIILYLTSWQLSLHIEDVDISAKTSGT